MNKKEALSDQNGAKIEAIATAGKTGELISCGICFEETGQLFSCLESNVELVFSPCCGGVFHIKCVRR